MMSYSLRLNNNCGYKWEKRIYEDNTEIYVKGVCLTDKHILNGLDFAERVYLEMKKDIYNFANKLDGHFAFIIKQPSKIYAFVDCMRSMPLFLVEKNGEYIITDSVNKDDAVCGEIDVLQKDIFVNSLYTIEEKTLFKNVIQLPAGYSLEVDNSKHTLKHYWEFKYSSNQIENSDDAVKYIQNGYDELFEITKAMIGEKQVAIPLSGGYDSRLVLNGLIKAGVDKSKIVAFTYGSIDNADAILSKKVANAVGVKHYFIEYNTKKAKRFFAKEIKKYCDFAGNLTAVACIQDLYAISELKEKGIITKDTVFIPGHGGPLAGECLYNEFFDSDKCNKEFVLGLLRNHVLIHHSKRDKSLVEKLKYNLLETNYFNLNDDPLKALPFGYETFYYFERQVKFILNSVRAYEYFGFTWLSPLFFKQQFEVWGNITNQLRLNLVVFKKAMEDYWVPELREIEFTGTKVAKKAKFKNRYLNFVVAKLKLLVCRKKVHYLFTIIPANVFYKHLLKNKFAVNINHLVANVYLKQFRDRM